MLEAIAPTVDHLVSGRNIDEKIVFLPRLLTIIPQDQTSVLEDHGFAK